LICIKFTEPDRANISSAESVMENISNVVLIVLVAAVVVAAVARSGIGAGIELVQLGVTSADHGGGKSRLRG
jgi:hypothetical protein